MYQNKFMEIHTPKILPGASEGGAAVFKLNYFNQKACLAQSPQLHKQMVVMSGFERVFEIGPVFRAEYATSHRHLCEFTGLDLEMEIKESYMEVLKLAGELFCYIFEGIEQRFKTELEAVQAQHPFTPFEYKKEVPVLTFEEGVKMLNEAGVEMGPYEDLSTVNERVLGGLVKAKYGTEFYMLHKYPLEVRPFYTMPCPENEKLSNSFDFFMRGEEIVSGA
jgi:aspartyl-tRNA synthetase